MSDIRKMLEHAPEGTSFTFSREGLLSALASAPAADGPEIVSTVQAAALLGYSPKRWRIWCQDGKIEGAYQDDGEGGRWRFPIRAARARLARRANRSSTKRGRRGPNRRGPQGLSGTPPAG